jgi:hypothetical protein
MPLHRVAIPSPNYSNRGGAGVRLIVLHTAEGARTIESLGSFFANPSAGVSSHAGIDDKAGTIGVYVRRGDKAWTQGDANPVAVSAELCAFAAWDAAEWHRHEAMLENAAAWIAEESAAFGIPIRELTPAEAQGTGAGVCQHIDLGSWGGGHVDCGPAFPLDHVLELARGGASAPAPRRKGRNMIASTDTGNGYWTVTSDGAVGAFGDAEYHGGAFDFDESVPGRQPMAPGSEVVGIAGKGTDGYWLHASDGGVFAFGSAAMLGRPDRA